MHLVKLITAWEKMFTCYLVKIKNYLKIKTGTVGYNNKILVSDGKFSLGNNDKVNTGFTKPEEKTTTKRLTKTDYSP